MKVWITSNINAWSLEEWDLPADGLAAMVADFMSKPDERNPTVIRWLSGTVTSDWPMARTKVTAQWHYFGKGIGQICTGADEILETIAFIFKGDNFVLEKQKWQEFASDVQLPSERPLIVFVHKRAVRDGQHRLHEARANPSTSLAIAYAMAFLGSEH
jgi:hypothetical protein